MKNKYEALCANCGINVLVGMGDTQKVNGKWRTVHIAGSCPEEGKSHNTGSHQPKRVQDRYVPTRRSEPEPPEPIFYDDNPDIIEEEFWGGMTSEDFNPNEGSK